MGMFILAPRGTHAILQALSQLEAGDRVRYHNGYLRSDRCDCPFVDGIAAVAEQLQAAGRCHLFQIPNGRRGGFFYLAVGR